MLLAIAWHAWIAFPLFALAVVMTIGVVIGYINKVVAPRYPRR